MPLGKNEPVPVRPIRVFRIVPHHPEIKRGQQFHFRERASGMPAACRANHFDDLNPHPFSDAFQIIQ